MPAFTCKCYLDRPQACIDYPWKDAQMLFEDCAFVKGGAVVDLADLAFDPTESCLACGKCCFVWRGGLGAFQPIARCRNLSIEMRDIPVEIQALLALPEVEF